MNYRIPVFCLAGILLASTLQAQPSDPGAPPPPPPGSSQTDDKNKDKDRGQKRFESLKEDLNLTDDQAAKVKAIMDEQKAAMQAIRSDNTLNKDQQKEKAKALRADTDAKIGALLTPEQKAKWDEMIAKRKDKSNRK